MRFSLRTFALAALLLNVVPRYDVVADQPKRVEQRDLGQATAFVLGLNLNRNLAQLIMRTALQTPTIQNFASLHGGTVVFDALKQGTLVAVEKYDARWTENLAKSYATHFTNAELASLLADKKRSPHSGKFENKKPAVGKTMQGLSTDLLSEATSDAVTHVVERFRQN